MKVEGNIIILFFIKAAKWFMLYMPISFLFYQENNLQVMEYLTLHAIYSGVIAFLEVPSGYIADVWGRKPAIVLGAFLGALGFGVYALSYGILGFLLAEVLLGIGTSLLSGADTAILYDTLLEAGKEKRYIKTEGRITALGNFSEAAAGIFVSLVVLNQYRDYFMLQAILALLAFLAALFLTEPSMHKERDKAGFRDILEIVNTAFRKDKVLRNFIVLSSAIGFASLSMAWMTQPVFFEIGIKESNFGFAWVILNVLVALGSLSADRVNRKLGLRGTLIFIVLPLSLGFIFIGIKLSLIAFIPLFVLYFIRGTAHPILKKYINQHTQSSQRATVFSLRSLLIRGVFFAFGPLLGYISEKLSLQYALYLCGISVLIPSLVFMSLILAGKRMQNRESSIPEK